MMKTKNVVLKNTVMLYILTLSNYVFGFITVPYLTRVLGATVYGNVGFGLAFATYVQLFLDFGFILSATAAVAKVSDDKERVSKIFTAVTICKFILIVLSLVIVMVLCFTVPKFNADYKLYILFWLYMAVNCLIPDFLYRGLEQMEVITIRTVIMKAIFTVCIFLFVKSPEQYYAVPVFYMLGALTAVIMAYVHVFGKLGVGFKKVSWAEVWKSMKDSSAFFLSRIASTIYTALNTIIFGFVYNGSPILGYYSASEKVISAGRGAIAPVSESIYPYMVKKKNYGMVKKVIFIGEAILIAGCTFVFVLAEPLCAIAFGEEYRGAANILRCMLPMIILALPTYVIAFPVLTPLGMVKYANLSTIIGAVCQVIGLLVLYATGVINVYNVCILSCFVELIVLLIRVWAMFKGLRLQREKEKEKV
ncbi:MAG: oligosaccharide flippase family protein [Lachnospira sp.]|nr:oligosaccharide flippase family protein [Lachnospira sp.]